MKTKILLIIFCFVMLIFTMRGCSNIIRTQGQKTGVIVKVADEGLFHKTQEAELIRGGLNNGSGSFGVVPFDFTIKQPGLYEKALDCFNRQVEVIVSYHCDLRAPIASGNVRNCFADKIEEIK